MGLPGQPNPTPPIQGAPAAGGYQLYPSELRSPLEIPVMIGSWVVVLILLAGVGFHFNIFLELGLAILLIAATLFFTAIGMPADAIQVGPNQFPHLWQAAQEAAGRLSMAMPEVYIRHSPAIHADAQDLARTQHGMITLTSALADHFSARELQFMIARQFGRVKCRHTSWSILHGRSAGGLLGTVGQLFRMGIRITFSWWNRTMELTADRAGLIGCQDIRTAMTAILKEAFGPQVFHRINLPALLSQMEELETNQVAKVAQAAGMEEQPYAFNRIRELLRFYRSPQYQNLAARQGKGGTTMLHYGDGAATGQLYQTLAQQVQAKRDSTGPVPARAHPPAPAAAAAAGPACRGCGQPLRPGARFCGHCGAQQG